nr:MAG TPA: putative tail fiber protein [Caudoviricetes sp.]
MYGLFAYKEITALRTENVYRLEIYKKDFSGTAMELEEFSSSPFSITLEGEGDEVYRPVIKSYLSINIIDKDQFDYTQFFTSDAFGFRVFLLRNGVRLWSGYITPDSFGQDLQYRSTINLVARDNIGYLSEIDYDWFDYDFVSIEQLLTKAFDKIQAQFSLDNRVNIFSGNKPITDAYIQTLGLKDKTWLKVLEEVLSGCGLQLRYINDNYTLHDIANEVELGGNYTPTFIDRSQRVDFSPAWREEQLEQDYLKIDNFFNKMPNRDKYEFIKLNNKDFSRPGERLYTIKGWDQSEANTSNGILFNNPDELYYNTSFNQDTGAYIFDKIPDTSMLINSDNKTEYPNSSISTSFVCKKSSTPLHINIDTFNELFEVEYYEGIGYVISRHYGFNYNTYHLNFYCNIFLKKEDGSILICKNNTWEPYDSSNQDYRIELSLPETPDPLTVESFQEDKTQLDIVVKSIPENGDLIFTIYRWGTSYTGTLLGSFSMRIDNIKMYFKDEKEDISGQESKITINESNNVKQSFDFTYGQIPDSSGGYLAFAGGLHDNDDYHTPLTDWYRSAFPENKYNLLELVGRGLAHHGKKARKIMTGTILFDGQDFSKILVIDNEKYVINGGTYDVTKETLTGEFIEVEPYSTDDYVITGGAVSGGSSNISTGGNKDTLLWTDNAANTKRVNELDIATSDDLAGSNLLIDNPEWSEAKRISADLLDDKFYWDKSLDTTEDKSDKDSWVIRTKHSIVSDKGISAYGLGSTSGSGTSGSLGELVNVGEWADEVPAADRVMVQLAGATHWSAKPLSDLVGLDTTALAQYLTENSYLKASDISSYLTWANLSGKPTVYPTSWELVTGRPTKLSDLTDDVVSGNYLPKPTWDAVFEVVTVDGTPALKVKYDILGLKGITAYADGTPSGGFSGALVDLVDVAVTNLASGDILKYNGTHFVNVPVSSIAGASSWDQITGKPEYFPTRWADVSGAPTSLPASDVYQWAKASTKPTYTAAEVGAVALNGGGDVSGSINASAYLTANTLRAKAALHPTISFVKTNDNSESLLIVAGNNLYYRPVASDTTNKLVYHSGNFNPDDKFGFSAAQLSDLNNAPNNAFFVGAYNAANAPVANSWSNGFTIAYGNNTDFKKQFCYAGEKWWTRGRNGTTWESWKQVWDSGNFNPGNYLPLTGGTMTGDITFGSNGRSLRGSDGGNIAGVLYDTPNARYVTAIGTGSRRLILVSPASIYRGAGGVAENYMIYDSSNSNLSTVDWAAKNITASGTIVSMSTVESRGNNSTGILPQMLWHIPGVSYTRIRMASDGGLHILNGGSEAYQNLYAQNLTAKNTLTATKLVIGGITIDVYNGALRVNGNLVATGGVTAYQ